VEKIKHQDLGFNGVRYERLSQIWLGKKTVVDLYKLKIKLKVMITRSQLRKLDINELRVLRTLIQEVIEDKALDVKDELRIGTKVKINHKKTIGQIFTVVDIKRKKAIVQGIVGGRYNVALTMLEIVK
jgi:hypothetical protein